MYDYFLIIGNIVEPATLVSATDKTLNIKTDTNPEFTFHITSIESNFNCVIYKTKFSSTLIKRVPKITENDNTNIQQLIDDIDKNWFLIG